MGASAVSVERCGSARSSRKPILYLITACLRGIVGTYHPGCTELIERNGGFLARCVGDGALAYFGYRRAHEHDAEPAVRAGTRPCRSGPKASDRVYCALATGVVVVRDLIGPGSPRSSRSSAKRQTLPLGVGARAMERSRNDTPKPGSLR
jgi:hypothetical protein